MLGTHAERVSLWETALPEGVRRPPVEPERVNRLFDHEVSFRPFVPLRLGRLSTPLETYLRLIFAYLNELGLLAKAIRRITATGQRIQAAGGAVRTTVRDRSRAAGKLGHGIAAKLRMWYAPGRHEARRGVKWITGELADLAEKAAAGCGKGAGEGGHYVGRSTT